MTTIFSISILLVLVLVIRNQRLIRNKLHFLTEKTIIILMTEAEELQLLKDLKAQNEKAKGEILAKIAALEAVIASQGSVSPEVEAALADLKTSIQSTDDIVADATEEAAA